MSEEGKTMTATTDLIEEARRFDTVPAEYAVRLLGSHSLIRRLADALEASLPTEDEAVMHCEHDWVDGGCGATAPFGTPGWEQRRGPKGDLYWLCPWSLGSLHDPLTTRLIEDAAERRYPAVHADGEDGPTTQVPTEDREAFIEGALFGAKRRSPVPPEVLACTVDESGGMAEIQAAKDLLSAAYGPGEWAVPPETDEVPRRTRALTFAFDVIQQLMTEADNVSSPTDGVTRIEVAFDRDEFAEWIVAALEDVGLLAAVPPVTEEPKHVTEAQVAQAVTAVDALDWGAEHGGDDPSTEEIVRAALEAAAALTRSEPRWEYRCRLAPSSPEDGEHPWVEVSEFHTCSGERQRRVKAGPWVPVPEGDKR